VTFYQDLKKTRQDFEVVFVSSDRDQKSFDEYYGEMPWLALAYSKRDLKERLSKQFKVRGIPTLVVLDSSGKLITANGRSEVMADQTGANFPWIPPTLDQVLGTSFLGKDKTLVERDLKGKVFGLYFSAHWCPPCKKFTPILAEKYKQLKADHPDFEIVFVSSDRDQHSFDEYHGEMPWLAVPFTDSKRVKSLSEIFEVEGIPTLVLIDKDLSTITTNGVAAVYQDLAFPFRPLPLNVLSGDTASDINERACFLLFVDPAQESSMKEVLQPIAEEYVAAKKDIVFFLATDHPLVGSIRQFANFSQANPFMTILDIPSQAKYVSDSKEITNDSVRAFLTGYFNETLEKKGIAN
jgi:nucleoredoxin